MVVKVYSSELSGSKEIKKRQQKVLMILDSKNVEYENIDITQPDQEEAKEFMREFAKSPKEGQPPVTPQIFNDDQYCGGYSEFDLAVEDDTLFEFLKLSESEISSAQQRLESKMINGASRSSSEAREEETKTTVETSVEVTEKVESLSNDDTGNFSIVESGGDVIETSGSVEVSGPVGDEILKNTGDSVSVSNTTETVENVVVVKDITEDETNKNEEQEEEEEEEEESSLEEESDEEEIEESKC